MLPASAVGSISLAISTLNFAAAEGGAVSIAGARQVHGFPDAAPAAR